MTDEVKQDKRTDYSYRSFVSCLENHGRDLLNLPADQPLRARHQDRLAGHPGSWPDTQMETFRFYNELADVYHLIYADWEQGIAQQASALDSIIREYLGAGIRPVLDASCGIGTHSLGLPRGATWLLVPNCSTM